MRITLPTHIASLVDSLRSRAREVWLIGSRANGTETTTSDWDLLVFGNEALLTELESSREVDGADVLVVFDGTSFRSPWSRAADGMKSGTLSGWKWQLVSDAEATYEGTKWPKDWGSTKRARRLVP